MIKGSKKKLVARIFDIFSVLYLSLFITSLVLTERFDWLFWLILAGLIAGIINTINDFNILKHRKPGTKE